MGESIIPVGSAIAILIGTKEAIRSCASKLISNKHGNAYNKQALDWDNKNARTAH